MIKFLTHFQNLYCEAQYKNNKEFWNKCVCYDSQYQICPSDKKLLKYTRNAQLDAELLRDLRGFSFTYQSNIVMTEINITTEFWICVMCLISLHVYHCQPYPP
jgi:hypothetical protein